MKKIIAALAGLSLFAAAATAEGITFNAWGRGLWNVIANGQDPDGKGGYDDTIVSGVNQSWGGASPRTDLRVHGDFEHVGYSLQIFSNGGSLGTGADTHIYVKPIEQIKAFLGSTDQNVLRGDVCFGLWDWDRIGCVDTVQGEEGWTFSNYLDVGNGVSLVVTPIEGLTIGTAIDFYGYTYKADGKIDKQTADFTGHDIGTVWGGASGGDQTGMGGRYVAAYSIEGIGTIKAALDTRRRHTRYDDKHPSGYVDGDVMEIGAAFDLVAVENLFASVGARIPTDGNCVLVTAGANYTLDALGIHALVGALINSYDADGDDGAVGIKGAVGVDYTLEKGIKFFGEFQLATDNWMVAASSGSIDDLNVTFGAGVAKNFSNGALGIAFEGSTTGNRFTAEPDKFGFQVPVKFEYSFF